MRRIVSDDANLKPDKTNLSSPLLNLNENNIPSGYYDVILQIVYTYDIKWERSELRWSNRWDVYLKGNPDDEIHYFSIVNSLMIVLFLTGVVAMIMLRTLHKDISSYNEMQTLEEAQEESGWKLVHGDVFRAPSFSPLLLAVLTGDC